jgi:hypothetical protein
MIKYYKSEDEDEHFDTREQSSLSGEAIAGIVIGGLVALVIFAVVIYLFFFRTKKNKVTPTKDPAASANLVFAANNNAQVDIEHNKQINDYAKDVQHIIDDNGRYINTMKVYLNESNTNPNTTIQEKEAFARYMQQQIIAHYNNKQRLQMAVDRRIANLRPIQ